MEQPQIGEARAMGVESVKMASLGNIVSAYSSAAESPSSTSRKEASDGKRPWHASGDVAGHG